ncbi:MAG: hypothetical protein IJD65_02025 [Mailhella sp.]|nr:hypothetical protein [Mailhella sp.]
MARHRSKGNGSCLLSFKGLPEASILAGSSSVLTLLEQHFRHWPFSAVDSEEHRPMFSVEERRRGFSLCSPEGRELFETSAEMLCDLGISLAEAFVSGSAGLQCLHCSAVSLGRKGEERIVVFPNVNRSGKSLLAACLMIRGAKLFADDLLGVTKEGEGVSFGLPPRLRLPLPPSAPCLSGMLEDLPGLEDGRYRFLYAAEGIAPFGEKMPVGAVVLPRRMAGAKPCLNRLPASNGLQCMAYQFQVRERQAGTVFELASRLCESLPLWTLEYDSPEEAAEFLMAQKEALFSPAPPADEEMKQTADFLTEEDSLSCSMHGRRRRAFPSDRNLRWLRAPGMHICETGSFAYLIPKEQDCILGVGGIGLAVIALLAEPLSMSEAAGLLAKVYPQTGRTRLESDIFLFFRNLHDLGLLVPASA